MIYNQKGDTSAVKVSDPRKAFIIAFVLFTLLGFGVMSFQLWESLQLRLKAEEMIGNAYSQGFIDGYEQALNDRKRK